MAKYEVWEFSSDPQYKPSQGMVAIHVSGGLTETRRLKARLEKSETETSRVFKRYFTIRNV